VEGGPKQRAQPRLGHLGDAALYGDDCGHHPLHPVKVVALRGVKKPFDGGRSFMAADNPFLDIDVATLTTLKSKVLDAIQACLLNTSYSLNGKSVTRADLNTLNQMLGDITAAIEYQNGNTTDTTFVSFNGN
jgi:hypothetical protein